jgi:hypothetical protein
MINFNAWTWVVDTDEMTCKNQENEVTIKIEREGDLLRGTIHAMPIELFAEISRYADGEKTIEKIVRMAEEEYLNHFQNYGS